MSKSLRNLRFLQRRHKLTGFDSDYLLKLNEEQLAWLESFARKYYNGEGEENPKHKKEANHRRYMAKSADAMSRSSEFKERVDAKADIHVDDALDITTVGYFSKVEFVNIDDLDPERLLLLKDPPTAPHRLRSKRRRLLEVVKEKT